MNDPVSLGLHVMMGLGLAACAGLRAFMPFFVVGMLARTGHLTLAREFHFLVTDPALMVFGIATVVEMLGDKFPVIDHALDASASVFKPVAATALFTSVVTDLPPLYAAILGLMTAGSTATVLHFKKATFRLVSSFGTFGLGNPLISLFEDVLCAVGVVMSVLKPLVALIAVFVVWSLMLALLQWGREHATRNKLVKPRGSDEQEPLPPP